MLIYDPDDRLVPREALSHAFFTTDMPGAPVLDDSPAASIGRVSPDLYDDLSDHERQISPAATATDNAGVATDRVGKRPASHIG